jgi:UDP-GlcNAc:undecaprenyl-phosphate GlcNAc-1-phosphate transferase
LSASAYLAILGTSASVAVFATPVARRVALRFDVLDRPFGHKTHETPVPYLGGAALILGVLGAAILFAVIRPVAGAAGDLVTVLGLSLVVAALGFIDDLRTLSPWLRLSVEAAAAAGLWLGGARFALTGVEPVDFLLTVAWVVGITNAQNILDNMDGLSAAVAAVAGGWILVIAAVGGQVMVAALAAGVAGCALGFLRHNFHPAKIYMGDGGSLFLGFLLAYLTLEVSFGAAEGVSALARALLLGVPIFDLTLVFINRLRAGQNPMRGGSDHTSHRLTQLGWGVRRVVLVLAIAGSALGLGAVVLASLSPPWAYATGAGVVAVLAWIGVRLSAVAVHGTVPPRPSPLRG